MIFELSLKNLNFGDFLKSYIIELAGIIDWDKYLEAYGCKNLFFILFFEKKYFLNRISKLLRKKIIF